MRSIRILCGVVLLAVAVIPRQGLAFQATAPAAAAPQPTPEALERTKIATEDRQRMLALLHIDSLRPPVNARAAVGDPDAGNWDETKANPYPNLPDPLMLKNGKKVTSAKMWWDQRRPEIVEDFDRELYGRVPAVMPKVRWEVTGTTQETNGGVPVIVKHVVGHVDNSSYPSIKVDIELTIGMPANAAGPVPVIMEYGAGGGGRGRGAAPGAAAAGGPPPAPAPPSWQQQVLAKGWGYAFLNPASIQPDNGAGLSQGIIGLLSKGQPRKPDDWGSLRALAWGASRAMDYFETDKSVNAKHVGIEGVSRSGKAALVALAYEPRLAIGFIGSSGEGGAKLHRRNFGEPVENLAAVNEYHWMAGNFLKYAGPLHWNDLPVDSHELIALCAPRPVFLSAGLATAPPGDGWVDAKGSFLAAVGAGPVYKLLGKKDLGTTEFPPIETALISGDLGFREHASGHTSVPNWPTFIIFASRYFATK